MLSRKSLKRLVGAGISLGLFVTLFQSASAATDFSVASKTDKQRQTVTITDNGFSPAELTLPVGSNPYYGEIAFYNAGTRTHSAKLVPGYNGSSTNYTNINQYGNGQTRGTQNGPMDSGGIDPGQTVKVGYSYAGDYYYTSYPDCVAGDRQPNLPFDCTPAVIHAISYTGATGGTILNSTLDGETLTVPGTRTTHWDTNSSVAKPYGPTANAQVSITDNMGYLPSRLWISPGTTVTFTNNGQLTHSALTRAGFADRPDNYNRFDSGGLAPGQSYSYSFGYNAPVRCDGGKGTNTSCVGFTYLNVFGFQSNQETDLIAPSSSGFPNAGRFSASTMVVKVYQVIKCTDSAGLGYCGN